ncbi:cytosine permease [Arsenophonus sp. ENCA]|uniref:cytosine permease n=1 Tax=Arsenophonus sp. ENCA TaxID=1987579 RepID=UPI000BD28F21|nr:cytosine permease [Arsenophonus sp. ENCA]PAV06580.1 cytosine permease [Arsenophonus sp. ENCA]
MIKRKISEDVYSLNSVPKEVRVSLVSVTLVRMGMATALPQFMLGATLGHSMTFWNALLATCLGSLIIEFISLGLGFAGMKEGFSTSLLARYCGFGRIGSVLVSLVIVISLIGWFGVQNTIFTEGILHALNYEINFGIIAFFSGIFLTFLVASGFKALAWTAKIAVPLFFIVILYIFLCLIFKNNTIVYNYLDIPQLSISEATTVVAGGFMVAALTTPDISRYCKNQNHLFWMITLCIVVGEFIINIISIYISHRLNTADIVTIMTRNAGIIGLTSIILSVIKVNDVNLYSSSLGLANALQVFTGKKWDYFKLTVCVGFAGTALSMAGILNHFVDFLSMLGVIFPPIAGVMIVDYFILKTSRKILDETREKGLLPDDASTPLIGWSAIFACIVGTIVGIVFKFGIPSLNSILVAGIAYWTFLTAPRPKGRGFPLHRDEPKSQ